MRTRSKAIVAVIALAVVAVGILVMDRRADRAFETAAALDAQYREMAYAMVQGQAGEQSPSHPIYRLYRERQDSLLKAGYLKTWEFPMRRGFASRKAVPSFFYRFATNFPGAEVRIRGGQDSPPVIVVCARDRDILGIRWFIRQ